MDAATLHALALTLNLTGTVVNGEFIVSGSTLDTVQFMHAAVDAGATYLGGSAEWMSGGPVVRSTRRFAVAA